MPLTEDEITRLLSAAYADGSAFAPGYSEMDLDESTPLKCAAVLIPLVLHDGDWNILYTRRTQRVESHKGQVSFPGGGCDQGETTPEQTALREANEEIGVEPTEVRILGRLSSVATISSFLVTPVVGALRWPTVFRLNEDEVERIFTVPLAWLAEARNRFELPFPGGSRNVIFYHPYDGELVWGATARMTLDFVRTLRL
ncbi:MAG TPA: CoA pyrophosphatase [Anaerolineales bacterium]